MTDYRDLWYTSNDGLRLYARDYHQAGVDETNPVILCMHGLTRNSADFEDIADLLAADYRIISVDQRGRGLSEYDPIYTNYNPAVYVQDMFTLIEHLGLNDILLFGTSLGGLMAMMMASMQPSKIRGLILNDICPELAPEGLERIQNYVGDVQPVLSWQDAAEVTRGINGVAFPKFEKHDWLKFAKRIFKQTEDGEFVLNYDPMISQPFKETKDEGLGLDLWPVFEQILNKPILVLRGELSDLLARNSIDKMRALKPDLHFTEVVNVGHAPILNEPQSVEAVNAFLKAV